MSLMNTLVELMDDAIANKRVSVSALARDCECSRQFIYQILHKKQVPTLAIAEKICTALGAEIVVKKKNTKIRTA